MGSSNDQIVKVNFQMACPAVYSDRQAQVLCWERRGRWKQLPNNEEVHDSQPMNAR